MTTADQAFELRGPDSLVFGRGRAAETGERASAFGEHAVVVTDPGIRTAGLLDGVHASLTDAGLTVDVFDGVDADPPLSNVAEAADSAAGADVLVGLGGGSVMDVTKVAALAADGERSATDLLDAESPLPSGTPTILLPTTAGTGSEVSPAAVFLGPGGEKRGLIDRALFADLALVDPDLSMGLPPRLTASTGLDAFAHAVGSYVSTDTNAFADALCAEAMELVEANLRAATFHGADRPEARVGMSMAATMGMFGRVNGGKSAIHAVAYGLQAMYHVPHGEAIAMVLPAVLEFNSPAATDRMATLGTRLYDASGSKRKRAGAFVAGVRQLRDDLDLDPSIRDVGGSESDLDELADLAVQSERHLRANPRPVTPEDARDVLATLL